MLSADTARDFVTGRLQIPDLDTKLDAKIGRQRLQLLNEIIRAYLNTVPFHNLDLMAQPGPDKNIPSEEESIAACLSGEGGLCWTMNFFLFKLLQALDFRVSLTLCGVGCPDRESHAVVLVNSLVEEGDLYLAEVGLACPTFQAICLDFAVESPELHNSFIIAKIVKDAAGNYIRVHKTSKDHGVNEIFPTAVDGWLHVYYFTNQPLPINTVRDASHTMVYRDPKHIFHQGLFLYSFRDDMVTCLKNNGWAKESENNRGKLVPSEVQSDEDTIEQILACAPNIPRDLVVKAVSNDSKMRHA